jgi:hypothetical protein
MRKVIYTPEVSENLADLGVSQDAFALIDNVVGMLADGTVEGFRIPIEILDWPGGLYRYDIGQFKLNYIFTEGELWVISVMS